MKPRIPFISVAISLVLSVGALHYLSTPYLWISLIWLFSFWLIAYLAKGSKLRVLWFNLGFLALVLGAVELYAYNSLASSNDTRFEGDFSSGYFIRDDILGYSTRKSQASTARKFTGDQLVFDVVYTIDDNGLRISPPIQSSSSNQCVLFFGGSYTFGQGVDDHETMPYVVGELTNAEIYNFGFHGYGPHQMLSAIERGMVEEIVDCQPTAVIYQAIAGHVARAAGLLSFGRHGPKYVLQADGSVQYDGHFDDGLIIPMLVEQRGKSYLYKRFFENRPLIRQKHIDLFLGIVTASREMLQEKYPGIAFHMIFWDSEPEDEVTRMVIQGLEEKRIDHYLVSDILPGFPAQHNEYKIKGGLDGHPNAMAHAIIARYVATQILDVEPLR